MYKTDCIGLTMYADIPTMTSEQAKMHDRPNIVLTGMPGAGKSTVGVILAKELRLQFVDTDIIIQTGEGASLQDIIDLHGIDRFLAIEERYVTDLRMNGAVIAPGGSVVLSGTCMAALRRGGVVVFLDTPIDSIRSRIDEYSRGIVKRPGLTLEDVWSEREPLYRATADIIIPCGHMSQTEIAVRIASDIRAFRGFLPGRP